MKKILCLIMAIAAAIALGACGDDKAESKTSADAANSGISNETTVSGAAVSGEAGTDVDLTQLSSTMVYSEVYNMMVTPDQYTNKTVKMKGAFAVYQDQTTGKCYFAVVIADATACCSQGLEFVLAGEHSYPEDYPDPGTEITVTGQFQTYQEGDNLYCHLVNAAMELRS